MSKEQESVDSINSRLHMVEEEQNSADKIQVEVDSKFDQDKEFEEQMDISKRFTEKNMYQYQQNRGREGTLVRHKRDSKAVKMQTSRQANSSKSVSFEMPFLLPKKRSTQPLDLDIDFLKRNMTVLNDSDQQSQQSDFEQDDPFKKEQTMKSQTEFTKSAERRASMVAQVSSSGSSNSEDAANSHSDQCFEQDAGFDGDTHLANLAVAQLTKTKMYSFNKAPFAQVVSGLKDKDCVLTVQLKDLTNRDTQEVSTIEPSKAEKFKARRISMLSFSRSATQNSKRSKSLIQVGKSTEKQIADTNRRQKAFSKELGAEQKRIDHQFRLHRQTPTKYTIVKSKKDTDIVRRRTVIQKAKTVLYQEEADEDFGNAVIDYGSAQRVPCGKWSLSFTIQSAALPQQSEEYNVSISFKKKGQVNFSQKDFPGSVTGQVVGNQQYILWIQKNSTNIRHPIKLQIDSSYTQMTIQANPQEKNERQEEQSEEETIVFHSFELCQLSKSKARYLIATIIVWKSDGVRLSPFREYFLNDPVKTSQTYYGSEIDKIIHKTDDGHAYVFFGHSKDLEHKAGGHHRRHQSSLTHSFKIGVIDQTWPKGENLPLNESISKRLNSLQHPVQSSEKLISQMVKNMTNPDQQFIGRYYQPVQFFSNFEFLAESTLQKTSRLSHTEFRNSRGVCHYNLQEPWCELILGLDSDHKHVYYLSTDKKMNAWPVTNQRAYNEKQISKCIKGIKSQAKSIVIKYDLEQEQVVEKFVLLGTDHDGGIDQEQDSDPALNMVCDAFGKSNDIIAYLDTQDEEEVSLILHIVPMNAAVSFKFDSDGVKDSDGYTLAYQKKFIDEGECLGVLKYEINDHVSYMAVKSPQLKEFDNKHGLVPYNVRLVDLLADFEDNDQNIEIFMDYEYTSNKKIDHFPNLNSQGKLQFVAITSTPDSDVLNLHMAMEDRIQRHFSDIWTIQYPIIAYRLINHNELALINTLQPSQPQVIINLGENQIRSFVKGGEIVNSSSLFLSGKYLSNVGRTNIQMLIEHNKKYYLCSISVSPFAEGDWVSEANKLYLIAGEVPIPPAYIDQKIMSSQHIKVEFNSKNVKKTAITVIIQYSDSIWACMMYQNKFGALRNFAMEKYIQLNHAPIAQLEMIRDHNQTIYFSEQQLSYFTIVEVTSNKEYGVNRREIYKISGAKIIALEIDLDNCKEMRQEFNDNLIDEYRKSFFILDSCFQIHHVVRAVDEPAYCKTVTKLSNHDLSFIKLQPWSHIGLNMTTLTVKNMNFSVKTGAFWSNWTPSQGDWHHVQMNACTNTTNQVSVYQSNIRGEKRFIVKPSPSSRKVPIPCFQEHFKVLSITMVTDYHIWVRIMNLAKNCSAGLKKRSTLLLFHVDGSLVYQQDPIVKDCIRKMESEDYEVVSSDFSNVDNYDRRIIIMKQNQDNMRSYDQYLLEFDLQGQAKLIATIPKQNCRFSVLESKFPLRKFRLDFKDEFGTVSTQSKTNDCYWYPSLALRSIGQTDKDIVMMQHKGQDQSLYPFPVGQSKLESQSARNSKHPRQIYVHLKEKPISSIEGIQLGFMSLDDDLTEEIDNLSFKIYSGKSSNKSSLKFLCQYEFKLNEQEICKSYTVPPCDDQWLMIEICYESQSQMGRGMIDLSEIMFFRTNNEFAPHVKRLLETYNESATRSYLNWLKLHHLELEQSEHSSWDLWSLPTHFCDTALIFADKKLTVSLGDLQTSQLPELDWQNNTESYEQKPVLSQQTVDKNSDEWHHLNLINLRLNKVFPSETRTNHNLVTKSFMRLIKVIILNGAIYYLPSDSSIKSLKKLIVEQVLEQENEFVEAKLQWQVKLDSTESFQFSYYDTICQIDRLPYSWIPKLKQKVKHRCEAIQKYQDLLQITVENQAILFAMRDKCLGANKGQALEKIFVEVGQIDLIDQFIDVQHYFPVGFIATFWVKDYRNLNTTTIKVESNRLNNLIVINCSESDSHHYLKKEQQGPYTLYSENDFQNLVYLNKQVQVKPQIVVEDMIRVYEGQTVFSIFYSKIEILEYLRKKLNAHSEQLKAMVEKGEPAIVRKLLYNLLTPVSKKAKLTLKNRQVDRFEEDQSESVIYRSLFEDKIDKRDMLMMMANTAKEFTLDQILKNVDQIMLLVKADSQIAKEVVHDSFIQTKQSKKIISLLYPIDQNQVMWTFRSPTTLLSQKQIQAKLFNGKEKQKLLFVKVKILSLRWLLQDNKWFGNCVQLFKEFNKESWFSSELMQSLFDAYWPQIRRALVIQGLIPFIFYFMSSLVFNFYAVYSQKDSLGYLMTEDVFWPCGSIMILSWAYFTYMEVLQFRSILSSTHGNCVVRRCKSLYSYYKHPWNILDSFLILSVPVLFMQELLIIRDEVENADRFKNKHPNLFFIQVFFIQTGMWFKLFDWLRLFSSTAVFPVLLQAVIQDILPYGLMMTIIFGLFGNTLYIFNSRARYYDDGAMKGSEDDLGYGIQHSILNEILVMVGEFHYQDYNQTKDKFFYCVIWIWFVMSLVLTQIIFLNTLIAIISDTFERVWDKKQQIVVSSKADLLCDWPSLRVMIDVDVNDQFLFVVTPSFEDENSDEHWQGKIASIKKTINRRFLELKTEQRDFRNEMLERQTQQNTELLEKQKMESAQLMETLLDISRMLTEQKKTAMNSQSLARQSKLPMSKSRSVPVGPAAHSPIEHVEEDNDE